jgi:hypothetical protein
MSHSWQYLIFVLFRSVHIFALLRKATKGNMLRNMLNTDTKIQFFLSFSVLSI